MLNTFERRLKYEIDQLAPKSTELVSGEAELGDPRLQRAPIRVTDRVLFAELSHAIVGAAIEVHRHLGPGQLESVYERALVRELELRSIPHRSQVPIPMHYKECSVGEFFADMIVDDKIIVELKSVTALQPVHMAQMLSYLHATRLRLGLLVNFNVPVLWRGVRRLIR